MHIAVCDDDIAQRKQTERLLGREADKWIKNGDPVYTYSYGSEESLLANLMQFDAILLDLTQSGDITVKKAIEDLRNNGSASLMVVCHEGLTEDPELPEDTMFLPKPIKTDELHKMMEIIKASEGEHTPLIELRGEHETLYVKEEEIIRAEQDGRFVEVLLTGDRHVRMTGFVYNFFDEIKERHRTFAMAGKTSIINIRYVSSYKLGNVVMNDGKKYFVMGAYAAWIKEVFNELNNM